MADGGRRGFAAGGEVVLAPTEYEWGIGRVWGTRSEAANDSVAGTTAVEGGEVGAAAVRRRMAWLNWFGYGRLGLGFNY